MPASLLTALGPEQGWQRHTRKSQLKEPTRPDRLVFDRQISKLSLKNSLVLFLVFPFVFLEFEYDPSIGRRCLRIYSSA